MCIRDSTMLSENFQGLILQFGNTKSAAPCIVLAIDIFHSARKGFCKLLHLSLIHILYIGDFVMARIADWEDDWGDGASGEEKKKGVVVIIELPEKVSSDIPIKILRD